MELQVYIDGQYYPKSEASVSVYDHGLLYGDGVFEGIRAYNGRVFELEAHLKRLYDCARVLMLDIPLSMKEMEEATLETLRRNKFEDAYIRLLVTRGRGDLGLDPRKCPKPSVIIITDKISLFPEEVYQNGIRLGISSIRKNATDASNPRIKSLNYLNSIMAKMEATVSGFNEMILLNRDGLITECTAENLFILKDGVLRTPSPELGILEGITRNVVMALGDEHGYDVEEAHLTPFDVYMADECFVTGTGAEILPVVELCGRPIGGGKPGPVFRQLLDAFRALANSSGTPIQN